MQAGKPSSLSKCDGVCEFYMCKERRQLLRPECQSLRLCRHRQCRRSSRRQPRPSRSSACLCASARMCDGERCSCNRQCAGGVYALFGQHSASRSQPKVPDSSKPLKLSSFTRPPRSLSKVMGEFTQEVLATIMPTTDAAGGGGV